MEYTYRVMKGVTNAKIERFEVKRRSDKTVTYMERHGIRDRVVETREALNSSWAIHFATFAEARLYCINKCRTGIRHANNKLVECKARLKELQDYPEDPSEFPEREAGDQ
jgi:hypothetical protein